MTSDSPQSSDPSTEAIPPATRPTALRTVLRGLAVSLPAVLTIVILIWVIHGVNGNIVQPATWMVKYFISLFIDESVPSSSLDRLDAPPPLDHCGSGYLVTTAFRREYFDFVERQQQDQTIVPDSEAPPDWNPQLQRRVEWMQQRANDSPADVYVQLGPHAVPYPVFAEVARNQPPGQVPQSARGVYMDFVADRYFGSVIPFSFLTILLIIVLLYFLGRFVSARVGRWIVVKFEDQVLGRLPVVRNVYGSVKQVTDFVFTENHPVEYRRVVAIEYPRVGIWSIGFVTGESMLDIAIGAGEPCVAVLIPTSPMPMTGFTVSIPKSEVLDLNLSVEQAMQFCISCGVLTPPHQRLSRELFQRFVRSGVLKEVSPESRALSSAGSGNTAGPSHPQGESP